MIGISSLKGERTMKSDKCEKCGGTNTYWREEHPDTGMDEMVLVCRDCKPKTYKLPLSFRLKEAMSIKWRKIWGPLVVQRLFRLARWSSRKTFGYCTWCGGQPGFESSVSRKGLRCTRCEKY